MQKIKDSVVYKFLSGHDMKSRAIKLSVALLFMCLSYVNPLFEYVVFGIFSIYVLFEFSMNSILWISLNAMYIRTNKFLIYALMWVMIAVLVIRLIMDLKNKKINYKNWRFITIFALFVILVLCILLPLCKVYSFTAQFGNLALFMLAVTGLLYVNEIKIRQFITFVPVSVVAMCAGYHLLSLFNVVDFFYHVNSSFGTLGRFDVFYMDPNITGTIFVCCITCWFVAYKKEYISKLIYFIVLTMFFIFSIMTVSKALLLVICLFGLFVFIQNIVKTIKTKNAKNMIELLWYLLAVLVACAISFQYVNALFLRLFNLDKGWWSGGENETLSNFTTGRTDLWAMYLKAIFSSFQTVMFGHGTAAGYVAPEPAHSMPLDYLFRFGILPTLILLAIFVIAVLPHLKKIKLFNLIPLICITIIYCSIGSTNAKYIFVFATIYLTLCCNGIEERNKYLK